MIKALISVFETFPKIAAAYVFGSRVYGKTTKASYYDVAVLFKGDYTLDALLDATLKLADALNVDLNLIDVVVLNDAPVEVAYDIIAKGNLIYCGDNETRVAFETRLMREYLDLKPYLDLYYDLLLKEPSQGRVTDHFCIVELFGIDLDVGAVCKPILEITQVSGLRSGTFVT